jgi:hypothetical protein
MAYTLQEELARVEAFIDEGEQRIHRQRELIASLGHKGIDPTMAGQLLSRFEEVQRLQIAKRDDLLAELQLALS